MAASVHSDYDGVNCNPDPYTSGNKGPIFDLIIAIIIAIIEGLLEADATYMRITYISGNMNVYLDHGDAEKLSGSQYDDILADCKDVLEKMDFTLDDPLEDWEIIYDNE